MAKIPANMGRLLFGVWVIGMGAVPLMRMESYGTAVLLGIILVAAGVCTLLGR